MRTLTIVLVEDNPADQLLFGKALRRVDPDASLHVFGEGDSALAFLSGAEPVDVIVLDVNLPGQVGPEVLKAVRQIPLRRDLPIVLVSGALDPLVDTAGADICLRKSDRLAAHYEMVAAIARFGRLAKDQPAGRGAHLELLRHELGLR